MPKIAFENFPRGQARIQVQQGEKLVEATIDLTDTSGPEIEPGDATLVVRANRPTDDPAVHTGTAPCGVFFSAEASGFDVDDHYGDLRYVWTFADPGHYTRFDTDDLPWDRVYDVGGEIRIMRGNALHDGEGTFLEFLSSREPAGGTYLGPDSNIAYGPHAAHVFARPGTYLVVCEARSPQGVVLKSKPIEVRVADPDEVFFGNKTSVISPSGNWEGAPEGSLKFASWAEAEAAARSIGGDRRILFHRGEAYDLTGARGMGGAYGKGQIGAYGTGADPVITGSGPFPNGASQEAAIWGVTLKGPYDSADPYSISSPINDMGVTLADDNAKTVWDLHAEGWRNNLYAKPNAHNIVIGNVSSTSWYNFGFYADNNGGIVGFCGVSLKQKLGTINGSGKYEDEAPFYADHGPYRANAFDGPTSFNLCDMRSLNTWSGDFYQPCIRWNGLGSPNVDLNIDRVRAEGGHVCGTGVYGADNETPPVRAVYDKIYVVLTNATGTATGPSSSGVIIRNLVSVIPDMPPLGPKSYGGMIRCNGADTIPAETRKGTVKLYSNTLVDQRSPEHANPDWRFVDEDSFSIFGAFVNDNEVYFAGNRDEPGTDTNLDLTQLWEPTIDGRRYETDPFSSLYAIPKEAPAIYAPLPESSAYQGADEGWCAIDDFFGIVRGDKPSRGAIEPMSG